MATRHVTRREFVAAALGGAAALAVPSRAWARLATPGEAAFVSAAHLKPPTVSVTALGTRAPGYLFVASLNGPGQRGPMILDDAGEVVWFHPVDDVAIDFRRQTLFGKPVLTWWEGAISNTGIGQGEGVVVDDTYRVIARIQAGNGLQADVHELLLTPQGTALITAYDSLPLDLTPFGGTADGQVLDSVVQEIDVRTGRLLFEWRSLGHVPLSDSYVAAVSPFDYFHVNSIDVDLDGNLLVSARNTSAVYKLDRRTGDVIWRLGGRNSDFELGPGLPFMYQHDARSHPDGTLTLFDDGPTPASIQSRALKLRLDTAARTAEIVQEYVHSAPLNSTAMGNAQFRPDGHVVVGWGTEPYLSEFDPSGKIVLDARFDGGAWNYRAFRDTWVGRPSSRPAVAVRRRSGGATVHVSWNGSTETAYWRVLGGAGAGLLRPLRKVARRGFETTIRLGSTPRFVVVEALAPDGRLLSRSRLTAGA